MNAREYSEDMSLCLKYGITIYQVFYARGRYKIAVARNGHKTKIGDDIYEDKAYVDKTTKKQIPAVHKKIQNMYRSMADKIRNKKTTLIHKPRNNERE
ncbi:hypothetical protein [Aquimarina spongiae]|uniref:Uncharacterized protein n=1 Tax=Aquimarina spongiae TaxID=570521 RepID=A0A1M6JE96_9FLAO|nr:hypothetical protein [Aquimarina spongiae]SHJ45021.1 hypothetical protein SAMN04488508_10919 [Aquimarina spongiae]